MRLIGVAFALALASTAQATPPVQVAQPDQMVTQVRQGCGAGMVRRGGVCVARAGVGVAAAAGYASGPVSTPGYESRPGPGPGYAYGPGPGYAGPGPGYAYGYGPHHDPGGPMRSGDQCWKDRDPWSNTGQGMWAACPK